MPLIVDTYNVLHVTGVLPPDLAGIDVVELAALIARSRYRDEVSWLICDGLERQRTDRLPGRVRVRFAGAGRTADDCIGGMVDRSSAPRRLLVVSSDLAVGRTARRRRCRWLRSEEFLAQLAADAAGARGTKRARGRGLEGTALPLDDGETDRWIRCFGLTGREPLLELAGVPDEPPRAAPSHLEAPEAPPRGASVPDPGARRFPDRAGGDPPESHDVPERDDRGGRGDGADHASGSDVVDFDAVMAWALAAARATPDPRSHPAGSHTAGSHAAGARRPPAKGSR